MTAPFEIYSIQDSDDVWDIPNTECMYSVFDNSPNISKEVLIHLLEGKPIVDLSDGEYIHFLQLSSEAIEYINEKNIF